jgi:SAM-dependent methyltransferase
MTEPIVNRVLKPIGLQLSRFASVPLKQRPEYRRLFQKARTTAGAFSMIREPRYEAGAHPANEIDFQCAFAARSLAGHVASDILDVASYRLFLLGLLAHSRVTSIDVRPREAATANETAITANAKSLPFPSESFDVVISLDSIAIFGLGRYGDDFDLAADRAAVTEMARVLRPGGRLILTTTITRGVPVLAFNSHRIYTLEMIHRLCEGLGTLEESFYSRQRQRVCSYDEIRCHQGQFDVYAGLWEKTGAPPETIGR